jgi:hypothetical protein
MPSHWFYWRDGDTTWGPFTSQQMKQLAATGELLPTDRVRRQGKEKAVRASRIKGLFPAAGGPDATKAV